MDKKWIAVVGNPKKMEKTPNSLWITLYKDLEEKNIKAENYVAK